MHGYDRGIKLTARDMIARHGTEAASVAREATGIADELGDVLSAVIWRVITYEIERLQDRTDQGNVISLRRWRARRSQRPEAPDDARPGYAERTSARRTR